MIWMTSNFNTSFCSISVSSAFSDLHRCRLQVGWRCSGGDPGDSRSSVQTLEPPSHLNGHGLQKQVFFFRGLNIMSFTQSQSDLLVWTITSQLGPIFHERSVTLNSKKTHSATVDPNLLTFSQLHASHCLPFPFHKQWPQQLFQMRLHPGSSLFVEKIHRGAFWLQPILQFTIKYSIIIILM